MLSNLEEADIVFTKRDTNIFQITKNRVDDYNGFLTSEELVMFLNESKLKVSVFDGNYAWGGKFICSNFKISCKEGDY